MSAAEPRPVSNESGALRIGELFAGYGGLGMGVQQALGGDVVWYSDVCKFDKDGNAGHYEPHRGACRILGHRFPGVPNLGDVSKVDWAQVPPIDVLTGGSPCQDLSHAGRRAGMTEGTRSNLWVAMREAIAQLRPSIVVWENVRGAYSAAADSAVEPCPGCVGDGGSDVALRALGRVLGDLSDLGYDCRWHGLPASEVGAPHGRMRVFVVATDTQGHPGWISDGDRRSAALPQGHRRDEGRPEPAGIIRRPDAVVGGREALTLLPTPMVGSSSPAAHGQISGQYREQMAQAIDNWGDYADAITRWERVLGRPAPTPTQASTKGTPQLAQAFVEWMMGLPAGWVTDVPGITRNEALKALGNGVVPQQCTAALREMLAWDVALPAGTTSGGDA